MCIVNLLSKSIQLSAHLIPRLFRRYTFILNNAAWILMIYSIFIFFSIFSVSRKCSKLLEGETRAKRTRGGQDGPSKCGQLSWRHSHLTIGSLLPYLWVTDWVWFVHSLLFPFLLGWTCCQSINIHASDWMHWMFDRTLKFQACFMVQSECIPNRALWPKSEWYGYTIMYIRYVVHKCMDMVYQSLCWIHTLIYMWSIEIRENSYSQNLTIYNLCLLYYDMLSSASS